jgi:putative MATE family efflux protein
MSSFKKFIADKKFYKTLLAIVIPIILQQFITQFVSLVDNLMIGNVGNSEMTGVSLANQLLFVFNLAIFGSLSGASLFASQYFGAENKKGYQQTFKFKWLIGSIIVIAATLLFVLFDDQLLSFFINSKDGEFSDPIVVLDSGKTYLMIMLIGNVPFLIKEIYATSLREMKQTFVPMLCGIIAIVVNLVFNTLLIFGLCGFPKLGVVGAAIATVISRFVEMGIVIIYTHVKIKKFVFLQNVYKGDKLTFNSIKRFLPKTLLLITNETLWAAGLTLMLSCYSYRGLDVVSSFNIANTISNVFLTIGTSLGNASAIIIGAMLGAKQTEVAKQSSYRIMGFAFVISIMFSIIQIISAFIIPNIYDSSEEIKLMARNLIIISAILLPFNSVNCVCYFTLRAGGRMLITILFDSVFVIFVRVPIAFVLSHFTGLSIYWVFTFATAVDLVKIFVGYYLINKGIWIRYIV